MRGGIRRRSNPKTPKCETEATNYLDETRPLGENRAPRRSETPLRESDVAHLLDHLRVEALHCSQNAVVLVDFSTQDANLQTLQGILGV